MSDSRTSRKRKEHNTDESEDNSDIKVFAASVKKKKSGPANVAVKQRYKTDYQDTWRVRTSTFRHHPAHRASPT